MEYTKKDITMEFGQQEKLERARKRVNEIKGFYIHLTVYIMVNAFILVNIYLHTDNFWQWGHFLTLIFWGVGVLVHAAKAFNYNPLFTKNWEERQIRKYLDKEKERGSD